MQTEAQCGVDPLTEAEIKAIIKDEADDMDYKTTLEYLCDIVDKEAEFVQECAPIEKIMRLIRRAHLNGFGKALRLYNDTVKETADYKGGPQERGQDVRMGAARTSY